MNEENDYNLFPPVDTSGSGNFGEQEFMDWYKDVAAQRGYDPNPYDPEHHYDYRAAYNAGAGYDETGHWPSPFKDKGNERRYLSAQDPGWQTPPSPHDELRDTATGAPAPLDLPHLFNWRAPGDAGVDQDKTPNKFGARDLPDMLFRYFGPNNVDPYRADYDRDPLLVQDTEGDLSNKELMNLFRDKQKEDPRGDNVLGLGDMRRLPGPPTELPWPLENILKFKESIFGDQFSEAQKRIDKRTEEDARQKQLKQDMELKKQQDLLNESKDIILRMRKPTDHPDEPDPYLNPYKENDPTINSRNLLFKTPPAQGEAVLRGRQPSDDPASELRMPHSLSETANFKIPYPTSIKDMMIEPKNTEQAMAMYDPGGGIAGGLPMSIMKYGPHVSAESLANVTKGPYSRILDVLNKEKRQYWTNNIPENVSEPLVIKGKKLPWHEKKEDKPNTGGFYADADAIEGFNLRAPGHPAGSVIATRGNEADLGTMEHELFHNTADLTGRKIPFAQTDPTREAKAHGMLKDIFGKNTLETSDGISPKQTLRDQASEAIRGAFDAITDKEARDKIYEGLKRGYQHQPEFRTDPKKLLGEELMAFSASHHSPMEGLDRYVGSEKALKIREDLKKKPVLDGMLRTSAGSIEPYQLEVPEWDKLGNPIGRLAHGTVEAAPRRVPVETFKPSPPPQGFPGAVPKPMPPSQTPTLGPLPQDFYGALTRAMGFHPSDIGSYNRGEVTKVMDFLMRNPEATVPDVVAAWKAGTLFPKPAPWWRRAIGG